MNLPKVAIIIPNYNKANYLSECVESATNQTYSNTEIIIIDDCSTDKSDTIIRKILKKYPNVKYYKLPKNRGVSYARNFGANKTDADYLTFLDADDIYINRDKIKNEVSIISPKKIAYSQWVPIKTTGEKIASQLYTKNPLRGPFAICKILSVILPPYQQLRGYMIPATLFHKINGYNTSLSYYEDFDLQCRLGLSAKFVYTKDIGEAYRLGTGGLSAQNEEDANKAIRSIQKKYYSELNALQKMIYLSYKRKKHEKNR